MWREGGAGPGKGVRMLRGGLRVGQSEEFLLGDTCLSPFRN